MGLGLGSVLVLVLLPVALERVLVEALLHAWRCASAADTAAKA